MPLFPQVPNVQIGDELESMQQKGLSFQAYVPSSRPEGVMSTLLLFLASDTVACGIRITCLVDFVRARASGLGTALHTFM